jgi:glycosyltransferase involved in cell wall biosynthesis
MPQSRHPRFKIALLVVSRLEREKRVDMAITALKKVRDRGIDCGLTIVGSGSEEKHLKRLAKRVGVSQWVEFAGFQNNLIPYYASADALLYPGAPYEGYGMTIVEALSAGVPVLANDVGVAREAGAEIAQGNSSADFGEALVSFLKKDSRKGVLLYHPYASNEEYLKRFSEDIAASLSHA